LVASYHLQPGNAKTEQATAGPTRDICILPSSLKGSLRSFNTSHFVRYL